MVDIPGVNSGQEHLFRVPHKTPPDTVITPLLILAPSYLRADGHPESGRQYATTINKIAGITNLKTKKLNTAGFQEFLPRIGAFQSPPTYEEYF